MQTQPQTRRTMWGKIYFPVAWVEAKLFSVPTLNEIVDKKEADARTELESAQHALKVAQYRLHIAQADIDAVQKWRKMTSAATPVLNIVEPHSDGLRAARQVNSGGGTRC